MVHASRRRSAGSVARSRVRMRLPRRTMLPYYGYRTAETVVRLTPRPVSLRIADAVAATLVRAAPHRFDSLRDNLRHVLPSAGERELDAVVRRNVRNLARAWVDVMEMPYRPDSVSARVHPVNIENMLTPLERGRGVVVVSLHLGSWEAGLAGYNHRLGRMALLAEMLQPAELFERVARARGRLGVQVIPIDTAAMRSANSREARQKGAAALRDVWRVLRGNGIVAMAIDRDLTGTGIPIDFFGAPASIPAGVVEVAIRSGAALVPVVLIREGDLVVAPCFPEITYDPAADRAAEVRRVTRTCLEVLEGVIRAHPDQWHVLDPIWTASPPPA